MKSLAPQSRSPLGVFNAPSWHRPWLRYVDPVDGAETPPADAPVAPKADEPLGEPGLAALQSERDARKTAEQALAAAQKKLQEIEDKDKTDQQRADDELARTRRELADLTVAKIRAEVAATKGVPAALLTGSTQAEIEKSAEALVQFKGATPEPQKYIIPDEQGVPALGKQANISPGMGSLRAAYAQASNEGK